MSSRSNGTKDGSPRQDERLRCKACGRVFTRSEHLKRHELIHSDDKPFQCRTCGREFVRKDALDRHQVIHQAAGPTLRQKGTRACLHCAASKVRCSGEFPLCLRCQKRGEKECVYPNAPLPLSTSDMTSVQQRSVLGSSMSADTVGTPQTQTSPNVGIDGRSHVEVVMDASISDPQNAGLHDQDYWDPGFPPTINWLSDDFSFLTNNLSFDDLNDSTLFPYLNAPLDGCAVFESPSVQHHPMISPMAFQQENSATNSPHQNSHLSLSPVSTTRSGLSNSTIHQRVEGELYVDGQPARLPRVKRRRLTTSTFVSTPSKISTFDLTIDVASVPLDEPWPIQLSDAVYCEMKSAFYQICVGSQAETSLQGSNSNAQRQPHCSIFSTKFEPGFPTKKVFEGLMCLYITSFQQVLPIFHPTTLEQLHWQLVLGICALGARFLTSTVENVHFAFSMHEVTRRMLYIGKEDQSWLPKGSIECAQLMLLHAINTAYSSTTQEDNSQPPANDLPTSYCKYSWSKRDTPKDNDEDPTGAWEAWKRQETRNRVGYGIWLVDCMLAIHFQEKPLLTLQDVPCSLPCHEDLWHAESASEWLLLLSKFSATSTMSDALHELYVQKKLSQSTGEFSQIILIHGLFHRMWEVQGYFSNPLSQWTPTAHKPSDAVTTLDGSTWLPSLPIYSRWRNASCDCIDVLHWNANAVIGAASGMEHTTVLHLHFSRVVLLTPYKHIITIARYLVGRGANNLDAGVAAEKQIVRRWAVQDQYKARLAMIHAGVLLWHVRRYSVNGFYEPTSVAMAILALWAFSVFSEKGNTPSQTDESLKNTEGSESEEARCDIILLDRPTDDELVQQYVKEGHRMSAILKGVGELCGSNGPERVLIEGRKLLKTLKLWGVSEHWISLFNKLIVISRRPRELSGSEKD